MSKITVTKVTGETYDKTAQYVEALMPAGYHKSALLFPNSLCTDCDEPRITWQEPWHDVAGCLGCGETARYYIGE